MHLAYLAALLVTLCCMGLLDHRFRLFFWRDARRASIVMAIGVAFFALWDFGGIAFGIFYRGGSEWMTGIEIAPEMPVEELFFLAVLCWVTMNAYGWLTRTVAEPVEAPPSTSSPSTSSPSTSSPSTSSGTGTGGE